LPGHKLVPVMKTYKDKLNSKSKRKKTPEKTGGDGSYYKKLLDNASDIIYKYKLVPEFEYEYMSPSVKKNLGYRPEQF
jgi:hypothetical protein